VKYATEVTTEQLLNQLTEQPKAIAALSAGLTRARLQDPPGRGERSINELLAHLRSCSDMRGRYIARIIAEDRPTIRAMNPRRWIKSTNYPELEFAPSLRAFTTQRAELLALLRPLPKKSWSRSATVTGAGSPIEIAVPDYARRLADHERSHVNHVARMVSPAARP
jgi:hypothetical protein